MFGHELSQCMDTSSIKMKNQLYFITGCNISNTMFGHHLITQWLDTNYHSAWSDTSSINISSILSQDVTLATQCLDNILSHNVWTTSYHTMFGQHLITQCLDNILSHNVWTQTITVHGHIFNKNQVYFVTRCNINNTMFGHHLITQCMDMNFYSAWTHLQ